MATSPAERESAGRAAVLAAFESNNMMDQRLPLLVLPKPAKARRSRVDQRRKRPGDVEKIKAWAVANPEKAKAAKVRLYERGKYFAWRCFKMVWGGCVDCGIKDYRVIQWDHIPERMAALGRKRTQVGALLRGSRGRIAEELRVCEPRCANCHLLKTHERGQFLGGVDTKPHQFRSARRA